MMWRRVNAPLRAGPYWFLAALGRGGMADIFLVAAKSALGVDRVLVLKRPRVELLDDQALTAMFLDEGRLATRLAHPNIVRTLEVAIYDAQPYIAMEFVDGVSLHRLLYETQEGRIDLSEETWLGLIVDLLEGLEYAHKLTDFDGSPLGIVHRDVSPGNVLLSYNGEVKLCDFGVAKAALHSTRTEAGTLKGKAAHLAPESLKGETVDARADIYSVGVLLFKCLTNHMPWRSPLHVEERHRPPRLKERLPDVSKELDELVARALAPDPGDRFGSASEMREALEDLLGGSVNRASRRALVQRLREVMETERAALRELIRDRVSELESGGTDEPQTLPRLVPMESVPPEPTSVSLRPTPVEPARPVGSRAVPYFAAALALGGLAGGASLLRGRPTVEPPVATSTAAQPTPAIITTTETTTPAPKQDIEVYVVVAPRNATIQIDGVAHKGNPLSLFVPPDAAEHVVEVSAPGYESKRQTVRFGKGLDLDIRLARRVRPGPLEPPAANEPANEPENENEPTNEPGSDDGESPPAPPPEPPPDPWSQ